ncbi:MAG TPA: hypothetical protein VJH70_02915 [Candidatus Paceibacterota bacterium]
MKQLIKKIAAGAALLAPTAFAQNRAVPQVPISSTNDIFNIIDRVLNLAATLFFTVAVFFIFWAGWLYLNGASNEENLGKAKNQLIYAAVAIFVGLIAFSFPRLIENFVR